MITIKRYKRRGWRRTDGWRYSIVRRPELVERIINQKEFVFQSPAALPNLVPVCLYFTSSLLAVQSAYECRLQ